MAQIMFGIIKGETMLNFITINHQQPLIRAHLSHLLLLLSFELAKSPWPKMTQNTTQGGPPLDSIR